MSTSRIDYGPRFSGVRDAMWALEQHVHRSGLDPTLLELVKLRASLINGWNRMAIAFRTVPGTFQLGKPAAGDHHTYPATGEERAPGGQ